MRGTFGRVERTVSTGFLPGTWTYSVKWNLSNEDGRRSGHKSGTTLSKAAADRKADAIYGPLRDELYASEARA